MIRLAGVVVWYNPSAEEKENIHSYLNNLDKLYIIDNSKNKSIIKDKNIEYIFNNQNIGIAKALNVAAKKALDAGYDWLLTMDQDTKMNDESFSEFFKCLKKVDTNQIGIITPWHDTKLDEEKPEEKYSYPLDVMTSGNFVNLRILKELNYFDENLFIDGVDIEYNLRLRKNNYKILQMNNVSIKHNLGDIEYHTLFGQKFMCTNHSYIRHFYMARNYRYIRDLYIDLDPAFCNRLVKVKRRIFTIVMYEKDKVRKISYMIKGIIAYKKHKYGEING